MFDLNDRRIETLFPSLLQELLDTGIRALAGRHAPKNPSAFGLRRHGFLKGRQYAFVPAAVADDDHGALAQPVDQLLAQSLVRFGDRVRRVAELVVTVITMQVD